MNPEEPLVKKGKENKKTNEVKKNCSSFIHFSTTEGPKIKQLHPDLKQVEIMKEIGQLWNALNTQQKQPYVEMAERDKIRYLKEMQMHQGTETPVVAVPQIKQSKKKQPLF